MAIKVKNIQSGEIINVLNVVVENGTIVSEARRPNKGTRFYNSYPMVLPLGKSEDGRDTHCLRDGWVLDTSRKPRTPRAKVAEPANTMTVEPTAPTAEPIEPVTEPVSEPIEPAPASEPEPTPTAEPIAEPTSEPEPAIEPTPAPAPKKSAKVAKSEPASTNIDATAQAIANALKGLQVNAPAQPIDREELNELIKKEVERISEKVRRIEFVVKTPTAANVIKGTVSKDFEVHCNLVQAGKPLYLYGPAGCGKSYEAKQIAEALGLPYFETSQAMFAHELKGYGDAAGKFVPTAFYRAFVEGGLFFLDEVDASAPEALVVMNNAIANRRFDFPVVGNVEAHPNFRVIAAGNTRMTGATLAYTARQIQDTSFKNRFFFELCTYDERIELQLANGDKEIVEFAHDLRKAARETSILQLCSYRQIQDLATLQECCKNNDAHLVRGSVLQEKEIDEANILYTHLEHKQNRWAKAMKQCIEIMKNEEVW